MDRFDDGGPIFPSGNKDFWTGLTVRDTMAMVALHACLTQSAALVFAAATVDAERHTFYRAVAEGSYGIADAMLKARTHHDGDMR
jgi:hypothetical protein